MTASALHFDAFVLQLREVFFALRGISQQLLADLDCTAADRGILMELSELGPQTVPALAQGRSVSRQAMQKVVDRLVGRKWLAYALNPRHQRSQLITITGTGSRIFAKMRARELELLASWKLPVRLGELQSVTETLAVMGQSLRKLETRGVRPEVKSAIRSVHKSENKKSVRR